MKRIEIVQFACEVCGEKYSTEAGALHCEKQPIREERGVKVGDEVLITAGDGAGLRCKVDEIGVHTPSWGGHRFAHTRYVCGKVVGSWGSRQLSADSYRTVPPAQNNDVKLSGERS